jgi:5-methyltetrahydrofolate corrinoid/iron sulfur protein methyltransferase
MYLIGERINAGFKDIAEAVVNKDDTAIKEWAIKQTNAKASYLDVCMGTASNKVEDLCWMIESVQKVTDVPICIDNNKVDVLKEAIPVCKKPPLVNSVTAIDEKMDALFPIIREYDASVICLVMDEAGSPKSVDKRLENAGKIFAKSMEHGLDPGHLFLDPIIMPLKFMQDQAKVIIEASGQFKQFSDPPCHIVGGLSNVANGTKQKSLISRTFAAMMIYNGLDAIICDVMDEELVNTMLTAELIMNKSIYADSYIEAFRK